MNNTKLVAYLLMGGILDIIGVPRQTLLGCVYDPQKRVQFYAIIQLCPLYANGRDCAYD